MRDIKKNHNIPKIKSNFFMAVHKSIDGLKKILAKKYCLLSVKQDHIAQFLGCKQYHISRIVSPKYYENISVDALISVLLNLNHSIQIKVCKRIPFDSEEKPTINFDISEIDD